MQRKILAVLAVAIPLVGCGSKSEADKPPESVASTPPAVGPTSEGSVARGNPDMTGFAVEVDTDHDGQFSQTEWQAQGLPHSSFSMFEKGRGFVTLDDFRNSPAPPGIDLDGDGKLTAAEFREFDRRNSPGGGPGRTGQK